MDKKDFRLLHIHAQGSWHEEAYIVGNTAALTALRDALTVAIGQGESHAEAFVTDGEGYEVLITRQDEDWTTEGGYWRTCAVPYTADYAQGGNEGRRGPWDMVDWEKILARHDAARKAAPNG